MSQDKRTPKLSDDDIIGRAPDDEMLTPFKVRDIYEAHLAKNEELIRALVDISSVMANRFKAMNTGAGLIAIHRIVMDDVAAAGFKFTHSEKSEAHDSQE